MNDLELTIHLSDEYFDAYERARAMMDLRKCRCWFDRKTVINNIILVKMTRNGILIQYRTPKGDIQKNCTYDSVLGVTELREGIMLRLSSKRLLFLHVTGDRKETELLMNAMTLLEERCKYIFKKAELGIHKAGLLAQITFRLRPKQCHYLGDRFTNVALIILICASFFVATVFVSQPVTNIIITKEEAITVTATYSGCDPAYQRGHIKYIDLEFIDNEELTVDGTCSNSTLVNRLNDTPVGTKLNLLIHPKSENILQIDADGDIILEFDDSQKRIWGEAVAFAVLGMVMYIAAVWLLVGIIRKKH